MEDTHLSSLVARLKDELNEDDIVAQQEPNDSTNHNLNIGLDPQESITDVDANLTNPSIPISINDEDQQQPNESSEDGGSRRLDGDQQPLLQVEEGSEDGGSRRFGDVEMRIPLRLQRMKHAARTKQQRVVHRPYFTIFICVVDVIMMIVEIIMNKGFASFKVNPWIGVSAQTLINVGGKYTPLIIDNHQWWRLLTPVFTHVGLGHLLLNLLAQIPLGVQLERVLGTPRIVALYFVSAIAGNLASALFLPLELEVGASTAIYGLASYYLVDLLVHWTLVFAPLRYFFALIAGSVVGLFIGMLPGIDNFAHLGGSAGGFLISMLLIPRTHAGKSLRYARVASWLGPPLLALYFAAGIAGLCVGVLREEVWRCSWCEYLNCLPIAHWCSRDT